MRFLAASLLLPLAGLAARAPLRAELDDGSWTAGVWRRDSAPGPIFGDSINASGGKFYLYRNDSAYCPSDVANLDCSAYPGGTTVFAGGNDTVGLDVAVPGGQQVYIAPDGTLSYTVPHSAYRPNGSTAYGFERYVSPAGGAPTLLVMEGRNWQLCALNVNGTTPVYQIYLVTNWQPNAGCYSFEMRTYGQAHLVAWEY